jgi:hypothetical protein
VWALLGDDNTFQQYMRKALSHLRAQDSEHWWCESGEVLQPFLELFDYADKPDVIRLHKILGSKLLFSGFTCCNILDGQLNRCVDCVKSYHLHKDAFLSRLVLRHSSAQVTSER